MAVLAHPVFLFCRCRRWPFFSTSPASSLAWTFGHPRRGFRLRFREAIALQVLLPAAEQFFPLTSGSNEEAEEVKAFLRRRVDEKTLFSPLSRPAQITKESQEEFARLMADAAGNMKMFAVSGKEGRGEGEGLT